jgi:D-arabinose 5-phosphate isomerase GutQ
MGSLFDQSAHLVLDAICVLLMEKLGAKETDLETRHTNL